MKKIMIKIIFILCFVSIQAFGIEDNLYEVKNIKISLVDIETNLAREIANEKAIAFAFEKVLSWILTNSQYNKLISNEKITKDLNIKNFVVGYQIKNEIQTISTYNAEFLVMFDKKLLKEWLSNKNIYVKEKNTPAILILPIFNNAGKKVLWDDPNLWGSLWQKKSLENNFIPLIFAHGDAEDLISLSYDDLFSFNLIKITNFAARYKMSYVFIPTCEIYIKNKDHFEGVFTASIISESKIKTIFNKKELKSYPGELLDDFLQRSINRMSREFEDFWFLNNKQIAKEINFTASYNNLTEWRFIIDTMKNLNEISEISITSLGLNKAGLEAYISYTKEDDLLRLFKSYRLNLQKHTEIENAYNVSIIKENDDGKNFEINKKKTRAKSDILVIE